MTEHSPTPWSAWKRTREWCNIEDVRGFTVATEIAEANARLIVTAVNARAKLVEALEYAKRAEVLWLPDDVAEEHEDEAKALATMRDKIDAALALAREVEGG